MDFSHSLTLAEQKAKEAYNSAALRRYAESAGMIEDVIEHLESAQRDLRKHAAKMLAGEA